jgi:hypothetical protein
MADGTGRAIPAAAAARWLYLLAARGYARVRGSGLVRLLARAKAIP